MNASGAPALRSVSRRGVTYVCNGRGPVVVLVHGWCLNGHVWMYLEQSLVADGYRVITPDLAGFGASSGLEPRQTLAEHADDVVDLLEELDVSRATLVGFAFGAGVILSAQNYARVGALVSLAVPSARTAPYARMKRSIMKDWPQFAARSAQAILSQPTSEETLSWLGQMFGATELRSALAGLEILRLLEPVEIERRWDVPTYFVHGADDPIVPPDVSRSCAATFGAEYVEVEASGHLIVLDQKQAVLDVVTSVASKVPAPSDDHDHIGLDERPRNDQ